MNWFRCLIVLLSIWLASSQLIGSKKRKKHKYKVVTPKPVCIQKQESVFSVTGFLTFAVVSATAISNIISNIDNNNNNNNNNDNNDNVNNNNQISDSADATNMGNAKNLRFARSIRPHSIWRNFSSSVCLPFLICQAVSDHREEPFSDSGQVASMVSILGAAFGFGDESCTSPLMILDIYRKSQGSLDCSEFSC